MAVDAGRRLWAITVATANNSSNTLSLWAMIRTGSWVDSFIKTWSDRVIVSVSNSVKGFNMLKTEDEINGEMEMNKVTY